MDNPEYVALNQHLKLIEPYLNNEGVTELSVNKPGEIWVEQNGATRKVELPELDKGLLSRIVSLTAAATGQTVDKKSPLLSATLPKGHRIQCVLPPACPSGHVILSIRRQNVMNLTLDDYQDSGFFDALSGESSREKEALDKRLLALKEANDFRSFLEEAVIGKKTILVSGGCSTGKTTLLNTLLSVIPLDERLVTIEDAREVIIQQPNHVPLLYSRNDQGIANVNPQMLVEVSLRLRPDRIIMSELRGEEAFYFLRAANTGHEGSASTIHADTPAMALKQLSMMCMQAGFQMQQEELLEYITSIIDVVMQIKRTPSGQRYCSEIWMSKEGEWIR